MNDLTSEDTDAGSGFFVTIQAKPKHGILWRLAKKLGGTKALAEELGISEGAASAWINLRWMPRLSEGRPGGLPLEKRRAIALRLVELTGRKIEDIFPNYVRKRLKDIPREIEVHRAIDGEMLKQEYEQRMMLPSPEALAERKELQDRLNDSLKTLSYREREIIKLRYGLGGSHSYTLEETAHIFKITRERIRQIEAKAIRKLRQSLPVTFELEAFAE